MQYFLIGLCIALMVVCLYLIIHISMLKKELRNIRDELPLTRHKGYNRQLTISLFDKDLSETTAEMNRNLDYQKRLKLESEKAELSLKRSVSDIAHDLRTPLTVIKGNLQLIEQEEALSDRGLEYLKVCTEKADAMKIMADDFFELSVLESDHSPAELHRINITNLLMQFIADHEALIRTNNLTPDIIFPEKSVFAFADESMLMRMLSNLLNNVIKYAKDSFIIKLEADEKCIITFANAIDITQQLDTAHLFERTYRGDKARRGNGAGLGLYIVKLLAEKQKAKVGAVKEEDMLSISITLSTSE